MEKHTAVVISVSKIMKLLYRLVTERNLYTISTIESD